MNLFDLSLIVAAFLLLVTALARLNDIKRSENSKRWWVRRMGLLMVFTSMVMFIAAYFTKFAPYWDEIRQFLTLWGVLLTWMTTPPSKGMPPWHKLITRYDPKPGAKDNSDADQ